MYMCPARDIYKYLYGLGPGKRRSCDFETHPCDVYNSDISKQTFDLPIVTKLINSYGCIIVSFCQCSYGLRLPGSQSHEFCRKRISILTNIPVLSSLAKGCPGISAHHHHHIVAWGSTRVKGRSLSLAKAAGAYPTALCAAWAKLIKSFLVDKAQVRSGW